MTCPSCRSSVTKVVDSRCFDGKTIMRRRTCGCGSRWSTEERVVRGSITTSPTTIGSEGLPPVASHGNGSPRVANAVSAVSPTPPSDTLSLFSVPDPERAIPRADPVLLVFPCDGAPGRFEVTESLRASHAEAFPALDVLGEYRKALVWIQASPANRKTAGGMGRFLVGWLGRAQNGGKARGPSSQASPAPPAASGLAAYCDWHRTPGNDDRPAHRPKDTCPSCKHLSAKTSHRPGGVSAISSIDDPLPDWQERSAK